MQGPTKPTSPSQFGVLVIAVLALLFVLGALGVVVGLRADVKQWAAAQDLIKISAGLIGVSLAGGVITLAAKRWLE
jgi:hypothetical protein